MIVIGFRPLASPAQKTRSAAAQKQLRTFCKRAKFSNCVGLSWWLMQQGQATFPSLPSPAKTAAAGYYGPACNNDTALLPRRHLWRNEANVINARFMADVEHVSHGGEVQFWVSFDKHDLLRARGENALQLI